MRRFHDSGVKSVVIACLAGASVHCDVEEPQDGERIGVEIEVPVLDGDGRPLGDRAVYGEAMADYGDGVMSLDRRVEIVKDAAIDPSLAARRGSRGAEAVDVAQQAAEQARRTSEYVRDLAAQQPDAPFPLVLNLPPVEFDFTQLAGAPDAARARLIESRQSALKAVQDAVQRTVEREGGKVLHRHWIVNALAVEVPGGAVDAILRDPNVVSIAAGDLKLTPGAVYDGTDTRQAVRSESLQSYGYDGEAQGRTTTPTDNIKIAIIDVDPLNTNHVGWLDTAGGVSRVQRKYDCTSGTCVTSTAAATGAYNHGTRVTSVAAGSITQGQDSNFPGSNTADQKARSWSASEADIYYYWGAWINAAIEKAVADGVDIISMSIAVSCSGANNYACSPLYDCVNVNQILRNALDAGVVPLACAGNGSQGGTGTCDLWWPGYRPETIAVNALNTANDAVAYHDTVFTGYATTGPIPITMLNGTTGVSTPGVDLVAPGEVQNAYGNGTNDYYSMNGCSNATPVVAGALAVMRQAFKSIGWLGNDARALMVNAFVMGDASNGSTANGESNGSVHNSAGYGRFHAHIPTNSDLVAPWGWGWRAVRIYDGEVLKYSVWDTGPESTLVQDWKFAVMWDAPNLTAVPDIIIRVVDTCNGNAFVATDYTYAPRKRLHLNQTSIGNKCLEMQIQAVDVPPEGTVVYMADYFHSGDTNIH